MTSQSILILKRNSSTSIKQLKRVPNVFNKIHSAGNVKPNYQPGLYHHPSPSISIETPSAFLPSNDPRKSLRTSTKNFANAPALSTPREQRLNLTPKEVSEIQKLRNEDPEIWTRNSLAKKFDVSPFTISLVSSPNKSRSGEMTNRLNTIKESWGRQRYLARLDRQKRKTQWYRDE
ncbi:hypothetical protein WICMUC_004702 [Wickerhamomyces mucosus]|uniref:54S ribosomal protein L20, mitochondrial n=1 Tax=Wickerhamomyces mucosus TaxID=1378264 RepID=A0A9P8TAJ8_9ASCO|nr:hypothetical protein WICMUC_004702 [Wickerhamomyces mucosus]